MLQSSPLPLAAGFADPPQHSCMRVYRSGVLCSRLQAGGRLWRSPVMLSWNKYLLLGLALGRCQATSSFSSAAGSLRSAQLYFYGFCGLVRCHSIVTSFETYGQMS